MLEFVMHLPAFKLCKLRLAIIVKDVLKRGGQSEEISS